MEQTNPPSLDLDDGAMRTRPMQATELFGRPVLHLSVPLTNPTALGAFKEKNTNLVPIIV